MYVCSGRSVDAGGVSGNLLADALGGDLGDLLGSCRPDRWGRPSVQEQQESVQPAWMMVGEQRSVMWRVRMALWEIDAHREDIILFGGEAGVISDEDRGRRGLYLYLRCVRFSTHRP